MESGSMSNPIFEEELATYLTCYGSSLIGLKTVPDIINHTFTVLKHMELDAFFNIYNKSNQIFCQTNKGVDSWAKMYLYNCNKPKNGSKTIHKNRHLFFIGTQSALIINLTHCNDINVELLSKYLAKIVIFSDKSLMAIDKQKQLQKDIFKNMEKLVNKLTSIKMYYSEKSDQSRSIH